MIFYPKITSFSHHFFINFHDFSASIFASICSSIFDGKCHQNDSKKHPGNPSKSILFATMSESRFLDAFWSPFGSLWIPFWLPLVPFGLPLAHFWFPVPHFWLTLHPFWVTFATLWLTLGSRSARFGALLAPVGSLLAPFGSLLVDF